VTAPNRDVVLTYIRYNDIAHNAEEQMLTPHELNSLVRTGADANVLSVYLDARVTDPASRNAAPAAVTAAVRTARAAIRDEHDLASFDRAAAFLEGPLSSLGGAWREPGWVAFLTPDGPLHTADLPVRVPTIAHWRKGPFISPYLRVVKQWRPVIVALVDSRSARLFRYACGTLTSFPEMTIEAHDGRAETPAPPETRSTSAPAPRGALAVDRANHRRRNLFRRLTASLAARVTELAGDDGWVLVGGTSEWARFAGDALPARLADRTLVSTALHHDAGDDAIIRAAKSAATELRAATGQDLLGTLFERAGALGSATVGVPATQRALHAQAVDLLLVTPEYLRRAAREAEDIVRAALHSGGDVEVLSGDAAEQLDQDGDGLAARLRFPIDGPAVLDS
jgi:hypothetical protein